MVNSMNMQIKPLKYIFELIIQIIIQHKLPCGKESSTFGPVLIHISNIL